MDVRTLCLGILALGDATGYEIRKMVAEGSFSFFSEASYGSIYPALTRLTEEGLVTYQTTPQSKRPDKKVYNLSPAGREELTRALRRDPGPDKNRSEFLASLLFAEAVSPERVNELIGDRLRQHRQKIDSLKSLLDEDMTPASSFVVQFGIAVQQAALDFLENNRGMLEGIGTRKKRKSASA
ncbi:MAG: PadR family transcriptional regulator [Proteobacteria bacterium]|nr:PadR family transcriptional regulator [Pseudomonadota bacterium]